VLPDFQIDLRVSRQTLEVDLLLEFDQDGFVVL
jgi:hypothetical protein